MLYIEEVAGLFQVFANQIINSAERYQNLFIGISNNLSRYTSI